MKILPVSTDDSFAFRITNTPDALPIDPGKSATLQVELQHGPMIFRRLRLQEASKEFRVDEVLVDGKAMGPDGPPQVGRSMRMTITNAGVEPAHFSGAWELDDPTGPTDLEIADQLGR